MEKTDKWSFWFIALLNRLRVTAWLPVRLFSVNTLAISQTMPVRAFAVRGGRVYTRDYCRPGLPRGVTV
jgi:hypothetical protein